MPHLRSKTTVQQRYPVIPAVRHKSFQEGVIYVSGSMLKPQKARSVDAGDKIKLGDLGTRIRLGMQNMNIRGSHVENVQA